MKKLKCDALRDFIPFAQFKNREKHPRRRVAFSKVAGFRNIFQISYKHTEHLHSSKIIAEAFLESSRLTVFAKKLRRRYSNDF